MQFSVYASLSLLLPASALVITLPGGRHQTVGPFGGGPGPVIPNTGKGSSPFPIIDPSTEKVGPSKVHPLESRDGSSNNNNNNKVVGAFKDVLGKVAQAVDDKAKKFDPAHFKPGEYYAIPGTMRVASSSGEGGIWKRLDLKDFKPDPKKQFGEKLRLPATVRISDGEGVWGRKRSEPAPGEDDVEKRTDIKDLKLDHKKQDSGKMSLPGNIRITSGGGTWVTKRSILGELGLPSNIRVAGGNGVWGHKRSEPAEASAQPDEEPLAPRFKWVDGLKQRADKRPDAPAAADRYPTNPKYGWSGPARVRITNKEGGGIFRRAAAALTGWRPNTIPTMINPGIIDKTKGHH